MHRPAPTGEHHHTARLGISLAEPSLSIRDLTALRGHPWIMEPPEVPSRRWAVAFCHQAGFDPTSGLSQPTSERLRYDETARALGIRPGTVRSRLNRARARLREAQAIRRSTSRSPPGRAASAAISWLRMPRGDVSRHSFRMAGDVEVGDGGPLNAVLARFVPPELPDLVGGDPVQPRPGVGVAGVVRAAFTERCQEGLGYQVVGGFAPDAPSRIPLDERGVPFEEDGELLRFAPRALDDLRVSRFRRGVAFCRSHPWPLLMGASSSSRRGIRSPVISGTGAGSSRPHAPAMQ